MWKSGREMEGLAIRLLGRENEGDDETVQTEGLSENENEDHAYEEARLLGDGADTGITDDADGHAGGKTGKTDRKARGEMGEALEHGVRGIGGD